MQLKKWPTTPREYYRSISELNLFITSIRQTGQDTCEGLSADMDDALRLQAKLMEEVSQKLELYTQTEFNEWYNRQRAIIELGTICSPCPFCNGTDDDAVFCSIYGTTKLTDPASCTVLAEGPMTQKELLKKMAEDHGLDTMLNWIEHKDVLSRGKSLLD